MDAVFPDLKGASVFITGGGSGIGASITDGFLRQGARVAFVQRSDASAFCDEMEDKHGVRPLFLPCDITVMAALKVAIARAAEEHGAISVLVNNAANDKRHKTLSVDEAFWDWSQAINLKAYFFACQAVLPGMQERGFGRIVNVASLAGYTPGSNGHTLYASVKSGLIKFSESINAEAEAAGYGDVHCTALCPGFTWSEFHDVNGTREKTNEMPDWMWMEAAPVVEAGIAACERGHPVIVPGAVNKGLATLSRLLPEPLGRAMVGAQSKRFRNTE